jgi:hypothetical protein
MELAQSSEFACIFQDIVFERASAALFYYSARATYVARRPIKNLASRRLSVSRRLRIRRRRRRRIGSILLANNEARAHSPSLSRRSII